MAKSQKRLVMPLSEYKAVPTVFWPTGSMRFDAGLGVPGFPGGKITELYGHSKCGKTIMTLACAAEAIKRGKYVLYVDSEGNFGSESDIKWMEHLVKDIDKVHYKEKYAFAEDLLQDVVDILKEDEAHQRYGVVIIDSLPAMTTKDTADRDLESSRNGYQIQVVNNFLRKVNIIRTNAAILTINHITSSFARYGACQTTKGGHHLKYMEHLKLHVHREHTDELEASLTGTKKHKMTVSIEKNKISARDGVIIKDLMFDKERGCYDHADELLLLAVEKGVVQKAGAWYKINDKMKYQGAEKFREAIWTNDKLRDYLMRKVTD